MRFSIARGWLLFAALTPLLAISCLGQDLTAFTGRVTAVTDGDVITVTDTKNKEHRIRLTGIDAPEAGQEFGAAARNFLSGLVMDQPVTVVGRRFDTDGRLVAQVFLLGRDVSYSMLWAGLAWYDKEYEDDHTREDRKRYAEAEKFARGTKDNIWSQAKPVQPWQYRKDNPAPKDSDKALVLTPLNQPVSQTASQPVSQPVAQPAKPAASITLTPALEIVGNRNSRIYHWNPGCPDFSKIAEKNRVSFASKAEAEAAGYRAAKNCRN